MTVFINDISRRQAAIITGVSILMMTIAAIFATDISIGSMIIENDAETTANNIISSEFLFRAGVFSWLIVLICDVIAAFGLYIYMRSINKGLSLIMAWFRLIYTAILGASIQNLVDVTILISNNNKQLGLLGIDQLQERIMFSIDGFYQNWSIGLIVFSIHILLLGYLILKSNEIAKIWGILLFIGSFGYMITNLGDFFIPGYENIKMIINWIFILPMLSEVGFGILLLYRGIKVKE